MFYLLIKATHVLSVVLALGTNLTYSFLLYRAGNDQEKALFMLNTIRWLDKKIANPSYMVVFLTGISMIIINDLAWTTFWIWLSLTLFILIALMGIAVYGPVLRKQVRLVEEGKFGSTEYKKVETQSNLLGAVVTLLVIVILGLMVLKPTL